MITLEIAFLPVHVMLASQFVNVACKHELMIVYIVLQSLLRSNFGMVMSCYNYNLWQVVSIFATSSHGTKKSSCEHMFSENHINKWC